MAKKRPQRNRTSAKHRPPASAPTSAPWAPVRRYGAPFVIALLAYLTVSYGLFVAWPEGQAPLVPGMLAGAIAAGITEAALGAGAGVFVGLMLAPAWFIAPDAGIGVRLLWAVGLGLAAAAIAAGVRYLASRAWPHVRLAAATLVLVLVAVNALNTTVTLTTQTPQINGNQTVYAWLDTVPAPRTYATDEAVYLKTVYLMKSGQGYYEAALAANTGDLAFHGMLGVFGYRLPTIFMLWSQIPGGPANLPVTLVLLWILASGAWFAAASRRVSPAIAALAATAMLVYAMFFCLGAQVMQVESWGAVPLVLGFAALLVVRGDRDNPRDAYWISLAVAACLAAALVREHFVITLLAGGVAALVHRSWRERKLWVPWAIGAAAFVAFFAWHATQVPSSTAAGTGSSIALWMSGGPSFVWAIVTTGRNYFAGSLTLPLLSLLGVAGVLRAPRGYRAFLSIGVLLPLAMYLVVGANIQVEGVRVATWGPTVVPSLLCAMVFALGILSEAEKPELPAFLSRAKR